MAESNRVDEKRGGMWPWVIVAVVALAAGCGSEPGALPWDVGAAAGGDVGVDGSQCDPVEPPRCEGGNLSYETTEAGCRRARCMCSDREYYDAEYGACVNNIGRRADGKPCEEGAQCASGYCDKRILGSEESGVCASKCEVNDREQCPDGWVCFVPGDVAGYCLPKCSCEDDRPCGPDQRCAFDSTDELGVCRHVTEVHDHHQTCE